MTRYISLDTESTGRQLLTASFIVYELGCPCGKEEGLLNCPELDQYYKYDTYEFVIESMKTNKIDLYAHDLIANWSKTAGNELRLWLSKHTNLGGSRLTAVGFGVGGDVRALNEQIFPNIYTHVNYASMELSSIAAFLMDTNKIPRMNNSLEDLVNHFGIVYTPHKANQDAYAGMEVHKNFHKLMGGV